MKRKMQVVDEAFLDDLQFSFEYSEYIMKNSKRDRVICNGDTLIEAQEDGYLFEEFLKSIGINPLVNPV